MARKLKFGIKKQKKHNILLYTGMKDYKFDQTVSSLTYKSLWREAGIFKNLSFAIIYYSE